jgi:hypothetical protein
MPFEFLKTTHVVKKLLPNIFNQAATLFAAYIWDTANLADSSVTAAKLAADLSANAEAWHEVGTSGEPAFENSWVNAGGNDTSAAFYKDPWGMVHIKGLVKNGTVNTTIFTLPIGHRPNKDTNLASIANNAFCRLRISSDGTVSQIVGSNVWLSIHCSFRAA